MKESISILFDKPPVTYDSINSNLKSVYEEIKTSTSASQTLNKDSGSSSSSKGGIDSTRPFMDSSVGTRTKMEAEAEAEADPEINPRESAQGGGWATLDSQAFR